jgi:protein-L-isoaspartate(D-aspartate) O-methyltransferase
VDRLIAEGALWSGPLIAAFRATPRHHFLDRVFLHQRKTRDWREVILRDPGPTELELIYADRALITYISPPTEDQPQVAISSSSQPSLMAQMLQDLRLAPGQRILEVGSGTGYNAALLAHVAGPGQVVSVDVDRNVLAEAWDHLRKFPDRRVDLKHADGRKGFADKAPYDRIMMTAATSDLEPAWLEQLADGGILLAPLTLAPGLAFVLRGTVRDGRFHGRLTRAAYFMPLRAESEPGADDEPGKAATQDRFESVPAPWESWFDRTSHRLGWTGFIQALAFHGWLRGLAVYYQTLDSGETTFGVCKAEHVCWLGGRTWHVSGAKGRQLGERLWQSFLKAGGPWPSEYRLILSPYGASQQDTETGGFVREGVKCRQSWRLREPRERTGWL